MNVVLISTYDLGRQPFGLASPQAWLRRDGHSVRLLDLSFEKFSDDDVRNADLAAFYLPMHTATRLALPVIERVKRLNPKAKLVCYGLYAPLNADLLRALGVETILGGEFEADLAKIARGEPAQENSLARLQFLRPDRSGFREARAHFHHGGEVKPVAYTEASRGCKHLCRHCPIVPVYQGHFRIVQRDVVLDDIRQQIERGARHVTFGDPDFFNGPSHAMRIVRALHAEFPAVTYDVTIKIEHLLKHRDLLGTLRETGCVLVTSAVESLDDRVLTKLEKNHTRRDFFEAVRLMRDADLTLQPTFIAFTPWTTSESYRDLLGAIAKSNLIHNVPSVQLALRLLITSRSRLLELDDVRVGAFDRKSLVYPWTHDDPQVDQLASRVFHSVDELQKQGRTRGQIFHEISHLAGLALDDFDLIPRAAIPYLDEPWYC